MCYRLDFYYSQSILGRYGSCRKRFYVRHFMNGPVSIHDVIENRSPFLALIICTGYIEGSITEAENCSILGIANENFSRITGIQFRIYFPMAYTEIILFTYKLF